MTGTNGLAVVIEAAATAPGPRSVINVVVVDDGAVKFSGCVGTKRSDGLDKAIVFVFQVEKTGENFRAKFGVASVE